ncbi:MAG: NADH-quinone oxidoreductase subunit J, partial [Chloroflexi bacterium]|nr:NADH-quinone oxidoreductase subunit J [Chloroflexota bacterium]
MLGVELALFIIVGAIAILAAVMMLVSENAVHAALFLILNFACVAFFYLMLSAPFLAMVQVTVYAGAIMVLFLFVIMLLGAEKQTPESSPRFSWLSPAAVGLTVVFLLVAGIAIIRSDVDASEPEPEQPLVRVVHAGGDAPAVDVYLDGDLWVEDLAFREASEFQPLSELENEGVEGRVLAIYEKGADPNIDEPLLSETIGAGEDDVFTYVVMPNAEGVLNFTAVEGNLNALDDTNEARLTVVNAFPCESGNCAVDIADVTNPDEDPFILVENLDFGEVSVSKVVKEGDIALAAFPAGAIEAYRELAATDEEAEFEIEPVADFDEEMFDGNHSL